MEKKQEILNELKQISPGLAEKNLPNPYRAPAGYFDALPALVMDRLNHEAGLPDMHAMAYRVPDGYFESLAGNILDKVRKAENPLNEVQAELQELAPLLNTISRSNPYSVPEGYFDTIAFVPAAKPAKVVSFRLAKKWTQYAAAAMLAGILVLGGFLYTGKNNTDYNSYSRMDVSGELDKLSETDLSAYLNNPESPEADAVVKNNINSMSDEELNEYLSDNQDMDMVISVSN
jgi:hypothetical protein